MYHYFSGKRELAIEAMRGVALDLLERSSALEGNGSPLDRIEEYLTLPRPGVQGCRVGRMTQDPEVVKDPEMLHIVSETFGTAVARWEQALKAAIASGELPGEIVVSDVARTLAAVIQGGYVLARAGGGQAAMDAAVRGAVNLLETLRSQAGTGTRPRE